MLAGLLLSIAGSASAADDGTASPVLDESGQVSIVKVEGEALKTRQSAVSTDSSSLPAQVTVMDETDVARLNVQNNADLFRKTPGVQSFGFGQGDIGHPFVMRGFSSDHGSATAVYIDGVPQNLPSSAVGAHGMAEYGWLTPDMIERIEVIKGPVSALYGDQALAGAINIVTRSRGQSGVSLGAGRFGMRKVGATYGGQFGRVRAFAVAEEYRTDGYRARSGLERSNLFLRLSMPLGQGELSLQGSYNRGDWDAPGYLAYADLVAGLVDPRSALYPDGGRNKRQGLVLSYRPDGEAGLSLSAYANSIERTRFASFAPAGLQTETADRRDVSGARALYTWLPGERVAITAGAELRHDEGQAGAFRTAGQRRTGLVLRDYDLDLDALSVFAQAQVKVGDSLKLTGGLRHDRFDQAIGNRAFPSKSGSGGSSITTPRAGLVYSPLPGLDLYANIGTGFRSAAATELSPSLAAGRANFDLALPTIRSRDIGANLRLGSLSIGASAYRSLLEKEIRELTPGSGIYASVGDTERHGAELNARFRFHTGLAVFGSYSRVKARIRNPAVAGQDKVTGNPDKLISAGAEYTHALANGQLVVDAYLQRVGHKPYYVGQSERSTPLYDVYNLRMSVEQGRSTYTIYAILQPREFASDQAGATINPKPGTDLGLAYRYTF
jgi:outer membrane receptor protein involved in Fe transport